MTTTYNISKSGAVRMAVYAIDDRGNGPITMTTEEFRAVVNNYDLDMLTADDRMAMITESAEQLVVGAEDGDEGSLARAAARAMICNAIAKINCSSLHDAIAAYECMRRHENGEDGEVAE